MSKRKSESGTKAIFLWVDKVLDGKRGSLPALRDIHCKGTGKEWADGKLFCALLYALQNDAIDFPSMEWRGKEDSIKNMELAFTTAEKLGVDKLLDAADLVEVQDVQSLFAYLISWHARWGDEAGAGGSSASPFGTPVLGNKGSQSLAARTVAASIFQKPETPAEGSSALPVPSLAASPARVKKPDLNRKSSSQLLREQREAEKAAALAHISAPSEVVAAHLPPAAEQAEVRLPVPTTISATESDRIQISKEAADKEAAEKEMVEKRGLQAAEKAEKVKAEKEAMEAKEKEAKENEAAVKEVERVKEQMRREAQQRLKDAEAKEKEAAEKENLRAREAAEKAKAEEMARKKVGEKAQPEATVPPKAMKILGSPHHNVPPNRPSRAEPEEDEEPYFTPLRIGLLVALGGGISAFLFLRWRQGQN